MTHASSDRHNVATPNEPPRDFFNGLLSRWGGLRCPSEHLALRWGHVDWERGRLTVPSPKTEHHEGGAYRVIPIFPELRPHLEAVFEQAEPGAEFVITRYRDSGVNLRTQLSKIIRRAGLIQWPKLWHNLRASRQTELAETFPAHVVCTWIGNSIDVAREHYPQVTDDHYQSALQKAVQQLPETARNNQHAAIGPNRVADGKPTVCRPLPLAAVSGDNSDRLISTPAGTRTIAENSEKTGIGASRGAKSGAIPAREGDQHDRPAGIDDADLAALVDAWPGLPDDVRRRIVGMVHDAIGERPAT